MISPWMIQIEEITPEKANLFLLNNTGNRKIRRGVVKKYALIMEAGRWLTTPESICFGKSGRLLNGQHRLLAVIESGATITALVIRGVDDHVFSALDRGSARNYKDALQLDKRIGEAARLAASICGGSSGQTVPDFMIKNYADLIEQSHEKLIDRCGRNAKILSAAPVRLAACVRMIVDDDQDYVLDMYESIVNTRVQLLPPIGLAFVGMAAAGKLSSSGSANVSDLLVRSWKVFDKKLSENTKIYVGDKAKNIAQITSLMRIES